MIFYLPDSGAHLQSEKLVQLFTIKISCKYFSYIPVPASDIPGLVAVTREGMFSEGQGNSVRSWKFRRDGGKFRRPSR